MIKQPATKPNPRLPEGADTMSQRDQALLKLERLMAENPAPEEAAEDGGALIDINELADAKTAIKPLKSARRPSRPAARPKRPASQGPGLLGHILQALIVLLVVVWVFLLGVLVGRSRPEEKGLAAWLEKAVGWVQPRPAALKPIAEVQPYLTRIPAEPAPGPPASAGRAESEFVVPEGGPPESAPAGLTEPDSEGAAGTAAAEPGPLFAVQVTLAGDETEAGQRVAQLEAQGFPAYFYQSGRRIYVRVGPFPTRTEAVNNRRRLEELGYKGPYVSKLR
jgi:cell division septation protein DedD